MTSHVYAKKLTVATLLARSKMVDLEQELYDKGFKADDFARRDFERDPFDRFDCACFAFEKTFHRRDAKFAERRCKTIHCFSQSSQSSPRKSYIIVLNVVSSVSVAFSACSARDALSFLVTPGSRGRPLP